MSRPNVPVCPVAADMPRLKDRLAHYRHCADERCRARALAAQGVAAQLAAGMRKPPGGDRPA